jgi:FkbM family methyltransferase
MKKLVKAFVPRPVWQALSSIREQWFTEYARDSYSQEGEDILLERYFYTKRTGFYIDVGAHHPKRFSNTYRLYLQGWRGLNIDANPGSMRKFLRIRPRDINIEAAVSSVSKELTYYVFEEPALNTFDQQLALKWAAEKSRLTREIKIVPVPLWKLLDEYVPKNTKIDLLTVDVEGFDYDVLQSNDWTRYSPEYILVECLGGLTFDAESSDPIRLFLAERHYAMTAKTMNTVLYKLVCSEHDESAEKL